MVKALTDRGAEGLRFSGKVENVFDGKTTGLVLRVGARTKIWYFTYRNGGPTQWLKLGAFGREGGGRLSVADARDRVATERARLVAGIDPVEELQKPPVEPTPEPAAYTFAAFVPSFLAFQKNRHVKDWENDASKIDRHILPAWGPLPLKSISRTNVKELLDTVEGKGLTVGVNRIQALVSRIFTVALDKGLIEAHPAARMIKRFAENARDKVLSDAELRALWAGLEARPGEASDAVRLRLLLGQRGEETAGLLWKEIDLEAATWTLPKERTKNGKRAHVVALSPAALAIIARRLATAAADETRVFPTLSLQSKAHGALSAIHDGAYEWKDLRRTVATRLAGLGYDETTIGRVLNHARTTVTSKHYNQHAYVDEIRQALTTWDRELQRILADEPKSKSKLLPLRRRR